MHVHALRATTVAYILEEQLRTSLTPLNVRIALRNDAAVRIALRNDAAVSVTDWCHYLFP